jgi:hypothetical protein
VNSQRPRAEAAAEDAVAAVVTARAASCFSLWRLPRFVRGLGFERREVEGDLAKDRKEFKAEAEKEAARSTRLWGWNTAGLEFQF